MKIIPLFPNGSSSISVTLGVERVNIITKYNYAAQSWMICMFEQDDTPILCGLMLIPGVDLLTPYRQIKDRFGSLVLIELNEDDYKSPDYLGSKTLLAWYDVGEEIVLPV